MMIIATAVALAAAAPAASAEQPSGGHAQHQQGQMDHSKMDHSKMGHMADKAKDCCCKDMQKKAGQTASGKQPDATGHEGHSGH